MKEILTEQQVSESVARMASEINDHYQGRPLTIIGIMTGSIVMMADLIRQLTMPLRVGVVQASSYRGETERGDLVVNSTLMPDIRERDVLLVDDIYDTGNTLQEVLARMNELSPTSVRSCVLLRKQGRQEVEIEPDFVCFDIPDEFVVGYGLDYQDEYRNLPFVAVLEPHEIDGASK